MHPDAERAGLETGPDARLEGREPADGARAGHEAAGDRGGDDVGRSATAGDHSVHLIPGRQLLAQQAERHLGDRHRIEGVHPFPGRGRRVGLLAGEVHVEVGHGQTGARHALDRPRVHHHGRVDVVEGAPLEHEDLPAATLLGRGAEDPHLQADLVGHRGEGQTGPDGARRDDVVPAGVPHVG